MEPFKSRGFILEGFPSCSDDVRYLTGSNNLPGAVLTLQADKEVVIKRIYPERLELWKEWNYMKEERFKRIKKKKMAIRDKFIADFIAQNMLNVVAEEGLDMATVEADYKERALDEFEEVILLVLINWQ